MSASQSHIQPPADHSVDLIGPDISGYAKGTGDIDYVHTYDSGVAGPHVAISALVHGNEPCGAVAVDRLLKLGVRPARGKLSLLFVNIEAYEAFDPADPNATRYLDEDLNRVWSPAILNGTRTSRELKRARELAPFIETIDALLDIHSMQYATRALMLTGHYQRAKTLCGKMGMPDLVVADRGHAQGPRLRDFGAFNEADSEKTALLIECGQHWDLASGDIAKASCVQFLRAMQSLDPSAIETLAADMHVSLAPSKAQEFVTVTNPITIASDEFRFLQPFEGLEVIEKAGTVIAMDGDQEVATPHDNCILIMPSRRLWKGQTAVRLGRFDAEVA